MDRITAMTVFTEVADRASLTAAAHALDMSRAMVSRYLVDLEHWLGVRLLHRTTRRVSLTDAGEEALPRCRQLLELTQELQSVSGARQREPTGRLRITTSTSFAQAVLVPAVAEFLARHPRTRVELVTLERAVNLVEDRIDLAVRIGNQVDETLVARRLGVCRSVICAAPSYLAAHGTPIRPADLRDHRCIAHAHFANTEYRLQRGDETFRIPVTGSLQSNETTVTREAAVAGAGIAMLPTYFVGDDLATGRLVQLLPGYEPEVLDIHALYLSRQHPPHLLRVMLDFLAERVSGEVPSWDRRLAAAAAAARTPTAASRRAHPRAKKSNMSHR